MTKKEEREAKKLEKLRLEKERMYEMFSFEREYGNQSRTSMGPIFMRKYNKKKGRFK